MKKLDLSYSWWKCKTVQPLWKNIWQFLMKLNLELPYNQAMPLLSVCPREMKTCVHRKTAQMFITKLFIIAQSENNRNAPSIDKLIN